MTSTRRGSSSVRRGDRSAEGAEAGDGLAEDEGVDVVGALVGEDGLKVVHVAADGVFEGDAVGAEDAAGLAGGLQGGADVVALGEGDLDGVDLAGVFEAA